MPRHCPSTNAWNLTSKVELHVFDKVGNKYVEDSVVHLDRISTATTVLELKRTHFWDDIAAGSRITMLHRPDKGFDENLLHAPENWGEILLAGHYSPPDEDRLNGLHSKKREDLEQGLEILAVPDGVEGHYFREEDDCVTLRQLSLAAPVPGGGICFYGPCHPRRCVVLYVCIKRGEEHSSSEGGREGSSSERGRTGSSERGGFFRARDRFFRPRSEEPSSLMGVGRTAPTGGSSTSAGARQTGSSSAPRGASSASADTHDQRGAQQTGSAGSAPRGGTDQEVGGRGHSCSIQ